ncbi:hypothetical protein BD310DRAFT_922092 [Dichomitus squalens]|uniref:NAD(P)-binding protein n=1 Tax=Dichomitus squalens TaxID=114155 RepID=A0A4Q9Q1I3_9APHY|nr:hypothetical protein BD310DRAFT_922092 [Dichomitus squalens]
MSQRDGQTLKQRIPAKTQDLPGLQKSMTPEPFSTSLETPAGRRPYIGSGKLKDRKAVITGGDSGIGRAVAILFAREGADVTIVHLPQEQPDADETVRAVEYEGRKCLSIAFDLEDFKNAKSIIDRHVAEFERVDVLVNNASQQRLTEDFAEIDLDSVEQVFKTNVLQMFALTKFALPHMPKGSSIINTTSVTTFRGARRSPITSRRRAPLSDSRARWPRIW